MAYYKETVPFEIAVKLYESGFDLSKFDDDYYYALDDITVTFDNYLGTETIPKGETLYLLSSQNYHGKYIPAPDYATALDWLMEKGWFLQTMMLDINYYSFEFKPINKSMNERICCNGDWNALNIALEEVLEKLN